MITYTTRDGGTVQATRRMATTDLHYRDATGRTVATVITGHTDAERLLKGLINGAA